MNYCVVGDVHGEYEALLNLATKTPSNISLVFVGDLIDRGSQSAQVIKFIREQKLKCVKGNHEEMMIEFGSKFIYDIQNGREIDQDNMWLKHGGKETLLSYGLISINFGEIVPHPFIKDFISFFKEDIEWMKKLPLYLTLDDVSHPSGRMVVVSHSAIGSVWRLRYSETEQKSFENTVLWGRMKPMDNEPIFNIFGHTPQQYKVDKHSHYVNVDTGAYDKLEEGFGVLSAYCVQSGEVYSATAKRA